MIFMCKVINKVQVYKIYIYFILNIENMNKERGIKGFLIKLFIVCNEFDNIFERSMFVDKR